MTSEKEKGSVLICIVWMPDKDTVQVFCCPRMFILSLADTSESIGLHAISVAHYF
jgi:hypothetical protein